MSLDGPGAAPDLFFFRLLRFGFLYSILSAQVDGIKRVITDEVEESTKLPGHLWKRDTSIGGYLHL